MEHKLITQFLLKIWTFLKRVWETLDDWKTVIGLSLFFLHDHLFPSESWYSDLVEVIAAIITTIGGAHKIMKARYEYKERRQP